METKERQFALPVDSEHKALKINLLSFALPHMRAFHLCWFGFFTSFVSTFAPAAMIPVVREDLGLSKADLGNAGVNAVIVSGVPELLPKVCWHVRLPRQRWHVRHALAPPRRSGTNDPVCFRSNICR